MFKIKDIIGKKFNYLTILSKVQKYKYLCQCDCGNKKIFNNSGE